MKKWLLILVGVLFTVSTLVIGCSGEKSKEAGKAAGESAQLGGLKITVNDVHFEHMWPSRPESELWFIVELTVQNVGEETEYLLFVPYSRFYIQDSKGAVYKQLNAYDCKWEVTGKTALHHLELEPGETRGLTLQFFDIPGDAKGLKLFCKESAVEGGERISISLEVRTEESAPVPAPVDFESWAEAAIAWAESNLEESEHWYKLCLRFVANAFMQQGSPPAEVPEGTWASAWDAVNGDQDFDLTLQDSDNWRNAPRGALIFFGQTDDNRGGHVGIYLGDGRIIHAYGKVRIDSMEQVRNLDDGKLIGSYIGWAYPPERWRPVSEPTPAIKPTPGSPSEVVVQFYTLISNGEYSEAKKLLTQEYLEDYAIVDAFQDREIEILHIEIIEEKILEESWWNIVVYLTESGFEGSYTVTENLLLAIKRGEPVNLGGQGTQHVELLWVGEEHKAGTEASVYYELRLAGWHKQLGDADLIKEDGVWKIDDLNWR